MFLGRIKGVMAGVLISVFAGCNSGPRGVYSDAMGSVILELRSGGKANFTWMGDVEDCSYDTAEKQLTLKCKGNLGTVAFAIHDDGSLTGPPGSFMPPLRKQK